MICGTIMRLCKQIVQVSKSIHEGSNSDVREQSRWRKRWLVKDVVCSRLKWQGSQGHVSRVGVILIASWINPDVLFLSSLHKPADQTENIVRLSVHLYIRTADNGNKPFVIDIS